MASPYSAESASPRSLSQRLFTDHPQEVGETYFEHLRAASSFAGGLAICPFCCFVHALVPGLFTKSASERVERMHERMHARSHG